MKPAQFEYHAPRTIEDAVALLARYASEEGRVLAGGQTLVPAMAMRLARPGHLIDINGVAGLDTIAVVQGRLHIGACARHAAIKAPGALGRLIGLMQRHIAHWPIRARGTFCGSLANADAASEWCLLAVATDAQIEARSVRGVRWIDADSFLQGYMTTSLAPDEIITGAILPLLPDGTRTGFYEFARRAGDFAQVMAAVTYAEQDGVIKNPVVAVGALEARPRRIAEAEAVLDGATRAAFAAAAKAAAAAISVFEDEDYRRFLCETAVFRALSDAA